MEENEKNIALDEKKVEEVIEKINIAILNDKDYVEIPNGNSIIHMVKLLDPDDKDTYDIELGGQIIARVKKGERVPNDLIKAKIIEQQQRDKLEKENPSTRTKILEKELQEATKEGRAIKLRTGREITSAGQDINGIVKKLGGRRSTEVWRVRDKKTTHGYKYICKDSKGFFEPSGSKANEGKNPRQMCWIQNTNGTFTRKPVDDMQVFGKYVMATDIPEFSLTGNVRTLIGQRTPRGEYVLMPALDHRTADTAKSSFIKDNLSRGNSIWEIEDVVAAAELANTIRPITKDGKITDKEVELVKVLMKNNIPNDKIVKVVEIVAIVDELKGKEFNNSQIKTILDTTDLISNQIEELKKENYTDKEIKEIMDLVGKDNMKFTDAKTKVNDEKSKEEDYDVKVRGVRGEGPWSSVRH